MNRKNSIWRLWAAVILVFGLFLSNTPALAAGASREEEQEVGFYVRARLPHNQINPDVTYFDLRMEPGARQAIEIEVHNRNPSPLTVELAANTASTNANGIIDYKTPGVRDETLHIPFSEIATVRKNPLVVPGGGSAVAIVDIEMPKERFDGAVLGGVVIQKVVDEQGAASRSDSSASAAGARIQNIISYIIAVRLTETDTVIPPGFELLGVELMDAGNCAAAVHAIQNPTATVIKGMELEIDIAQLGDGESVASARHANFDMAPNSVLEHPVSTKAGTFSPGQYKSTVVVRYAGQAWQFTEEFEISGNEARAINASAAKSVKTVFPWWGIALITVMAAAILVLIFLLMRNRRRQSGQELYRRKPRQ